MTRLVTLLMGLTFLASISPAFAQGERYTTVINGHPLTEQQRAEFIRIYRTPPLGGDFWYDARSGLWGVRGREAFGVIRPGHDYGPLSPTASNGTTGVFINGRQINMAEALYIKSLFGAVLPGRWWLDGATGYYGLEGSPIPAGNLYVAARSARSRGGNAVNYYQDGMGTNIAISSGCATGSTGVGSSKVDFVVGCN